MRVGADVGVAHRIALTKRNQLGLRGRDIQNHLRHDLVGGRIALPQSVASGASEVIPVLELLGIVHEFDHADFPATLKAVQVLDRVRKDQLGIERNT